jgi:hypothetical protein
MKRILMVAAPVLLFGASLWGDITFFSDNFESYAPGSNLAGQGGWTGCGTIPINTSSSLPTQVARVDLGSAGCTGAKSGFAYLDHTFSGNIGSNAVTTLSFNAYAPNGSHDMNVFLSDSGGNNINGVDFETDRTVPGWQLIFYKNGDGTTKILIPGGTGAPVSFKIVIDVPDQDLYAIYDFGGGPQTTGTLSLAGDTTLSQWNTLSLAGDYRFGLPQGQIDNLSLTQKPTATPEPCYLSLLGAGVAAMLLKRARSN